MHSVFHTVPFILAVSCCLAAGGKAPSKAERIAAAGGFVERPAQGPEILFVNGQSRLPAGIPGEVAAGLAQSLRLRVRACAAAEAARAGAGALRVTVVDDAAAPALLVAPDEGWARVNVAPLAAGAADDVAAARLRKELLRAFGFLMAGEHAVAAPADLDKIGEPVLSAEALMRAVRHARDLGMEPPRRATYRRAAQEGWAPAPTNDVQRAIAEKFGKASK